LHSEELHDLYLLTKYHSSGKIKNETGGPAARLGKGEGHTGFWWGNLRKGNHLKELGIDGRIISKWIFKKWVEA
jgi:hypothetical protein